MISKCLINPQTSALVEYKVNDLIVMQEYNGMLMFDSKA